MADLREARIVLAYIMKRITNERSEPEEERE